MKNHLKKLEYIEFPLIFFLFVLPPLTINQVTEELIILQSPLFLCYYTLICAFFYVRLNNTVQLKIKRTSIISFISLILLIAGMISLSTIAYTWGVDDSTVEKLSNILQKANKNMGWYFHLFVSTLVLANFEEMLFRSFLPIKGAQFFALFIKRHTNICIILSELLAVICFAFAHRYLGNFAVLNALYAGAVLRFTVKKTGTIWSTCVVHTIYNLLLFVGYTYRCVL